MESFDAFARECTAHLDDIARSVEALVPLAEDDSSAGAMVECARTTAAQVSALMSCAEQLALPHTSDAAALQRELFVAAAQAIREAVLVTLRCAKEQFDSPFDAATRAAYAEARQSVQRAIERTRHALELLRLSVVHRVVVEDRGDGGALQRTERFAEAVGHLLDVLPAPGTRRPMEDASDADARACDVVLSAMRQCVVALGALEELALPVPLSGLKLATKELLTLARAYTWSEERPAQQMTELRQAVAQVSTVVKSVLLQIQADAVTSPSPAPADVSPSSSLDSADVLLGDLSVHDAVARALVAASPELGRLWMQLPAASRSAAISRLRDALVVATSVRPATTTTATATITTTTTSVVAPPAPELAANGAASTSNALSRVRGQTAHTHSSPLLPTLRPRVKTVTAIRRQPNADRDGAVKSATTSLQKFVQEHVRERDAAAQKQLDQFAGVSDLAQWQQLLASNDFIHVSDVVGGVSLNIDSGSTLSKAAVAYILSSNVAVIKTKTPVGAVQEATRGLLQEGARILRSMHERAEAENQPMDVLTVVSHCVQQYDEFDVRAVVPDPNMVQNASQETFGSALRLLYTRSDNVRALAMHLQMTLGALGAQGRGVGANGALPLSIVLQAAAGGAALVEAVKELHAVVLTAREMSALSRAEAKVAATPRDEAADVLDFWSDTLRRRAQAAAPPAEEASPARLSAPADGPPLKKPSPASSRKLMAGSLGRSKRSVHGRLSSVWDSMRRDSAPGAATHIMETPLLKRGTLNQLVESITHASLYDHLYMSAFIATYRSFATPSLLLTRLLERYAAPADRVSVSEVAAVQLRVPVVLKYWLANQPDDFDDARLDRVVEFACTKLQRDQPRLAPQLLAEVERQRHLRKNRKAIFETPPIDVAVPLKGTYTATDLLMNMSSSETARQLTLIDHAIYCAIHPTELLNQSWNKATRRHQSLNVFALVTRLNRISYWIPTTVLWHDTDAKRARVIGKFIEIARDLRALNNFHTLMGFIAGLNMAAVSQSRLKRAWALVPPQLVATFGELETLMAFTGSFKNYQAALRAAKPPCCPYLGSLLGFLISNDEGNPDMVDGLINFEKRQDIWGYIQQVNSYQKERYAWPEVEPLHSLLTALPAFNDRDLYSLSVMHEKRAPKQTE